MARKSKSTRRDFLKGKSVAKAISELPDRISPAPQSGESTSKSPRTESQVSGSEHPEPVIVEETTAAYLIQIARDAMACEFQVLLNAGQHRDATESALLALDRVEELEAQLTVYRDDSEVSLINLEARKQPVTVEEGLANLLAHAIQISEDTGGAFDITSGPLTRLWGFFRREGRFPDESEVSRTLESVGFRQLELDLQKRQIRFASPEIKINLGAIGKGYALDQASEILLAQGVVDFLIHGGYSSIRAAGARSDPNAGRPGWKIGLRNPLRQTQQLGEINLSNRALGTSGSGNQFFHFQGRRFGHVIDPRTGYPNAEILSATVLAPNATLADALATASFVLGVEATREYCQSHPEIGVIFALPGKQQNDLDVVTIGIDDDEWSPT